MDETDFEFEYEYEEYVQMTVAVETYVHCRRDELADDGRKRDRLIQ